MSSLFARPRLHLWPLLFLGALLGAGCAGMAPGEEGDEADEGSEKSEKMADLTQKLELARLELELTRLEGQQELATAERELVGARIEAEVAHMEQEAFTTSARQRGLEESRLDVDRSRGRAEDASAELAELESMYAAEEFATKTKELVLTRGRRDLELARRALDLAERRRKELEGFELPSKERELAQGLLEAEMGVLEAEQALERIGLEHKIALTKGEMEVQELARKLEKAKKKGPTSSDQSSDPGGDGAR